MTLHGVKRGSRARGLVATAICCIVFSSPTAGFAQPGRPFTPPPPPPPPSIPSPPRVPSYTPPSPINQQSAQNQMEQFRLNNYTDNLKSQQNLDAILRSTRSNSDRGERFGRNRAKLPNVVISVTKVEANSQCDRLGLMKGDVVVSYDGTAIKSIEHLRDLAKQNPGENRKRMLVVIRDGETLRFEVRPGPLGLSMQVKRNAMG